MHLHHLSTLKCPLIAPHVCSLGQNLASRFLVVLFCSPFNAVAPLSHQETDGSAVFGASAPAAVGGPCLLGTGMGRDLPLRLPRAGMGGCGAARTSLAEKLPLREGLFRRGSVRLVPRSAGSLGAFPWGASASRPLCCWCSGLPW